MKLEEYGYNEFFEALFAQCADGLEPARIIAEHKSVFIAATGSGELPAHLSGKYLYMLEEKGGKPTVGDFVCVKIAEEGDRAVIHEYLPRKTLFGRKDAFSKSLFQPVCANFDTVFICMALNNDFNTARLERYLLMAKESGAQAAIVLTKADISHDAELQSSICRAIAGDLPVHAVSAYDGTGIEELSCYFGQGKTVVALGSSGVGKSTLINAIVGEEVMKTGEIREDDSRGRHTTTHRQLIKMPCGGLYIDTPGMREIGLIDAENSVDEFYSDIEQLISQCRFKDCGHKSEPGCAVKQAIYNGSLTSERYKKYEKYKREAMRMNDRSAYIEMQKKFIKQVISAKKR